MPMSWEVGLSFSQMPTPGDHRGPRGQAVALSLAPGSPTISPSLGPAWDYCAWVMGDQGKHPLRHPFSGTPSNSRRQGRAHPACVLPLRVPERRPLDLQGPGSSTVGLGPSVCDIEVSPRGLILLQMVTVSLLKCHGSCLRIAKYCPGLENPRNSLSLGVLALGPGNEKVVRGVGQMATHEM